LNVRQLEGFYVPFSSSLDLTANARMHALAERLRANLLESITDLYPGYINLYVEFDANLVARDTVKTWVKKHALNLEAKASSGREVVIPVRYDGEDLEFVASETGLTVAQVIEKHSSVTYQTYTVGFTPGYPFLGKLDPALHLPRRKTPRKKVPAHSVAIAVGQTGIYPLATPGGWHILGSALTAVYDPHREKPFLLEPGDNVRFVPSEGETPPEASVLEVLPTRPKFPILKVEKPGLLDLIVDEGRFLTGHYGMARSGAMDTASARAANALVGNTANTALLEMTLKGASFRVLKDVVIGFAGHGMKPTLNGDALPAFQSFQVRDGDLLEFVPLSQGVRGYLAVPGGFESSSFMGSKSTDLTGRIGRALVSGEILGMTRAEHHNRAGYSLPSRALPATVQVRLQAGPQATPEALAALCSGEFTVSSPDRMGVRLEGVKVPGGELISEATPMGGVQITIDGDPILLLNDRGRIGGYAKPAVVDPRDLELVAQLRPGQKLRFRLVGNPDPAQWFLTL
jgi:KipI family sensor histidine kinase inhibitor